MRVMKCKLAWSLICLAGLIAPLVWLAPTRVWRSVSIDGFGPVSNTDQESEPVGQSITIWKALGGAFVEEAVAVYSSPEAARKAFEEPADPAVHTVSSDADRVVQVSGQESDQGAALIVTLHGREIHMVSAASLKYARAFENAWLRL